MEKEILVEVSARHVHLSAEQVEILFGEGHTLTPKKWLSQPGQFLSEERVNVVGPKKTFANVAVLGPARASAQVELALTDCYALGVQGVLRDSGDTKGTPGVTITTDMAEIALEEGVIVPKRHIHMTTKDAEELGLTDKQIVSVKVDEPNGRKLIFDDVLVRVRDDFAFAMHIDTDEANAAWISGYGKGKIEIR